MADPEAARPLPGVAELLGPLAVWFAAVALISGRPAAYLTEHAAAPSMCCLGLYGLQEISDGQVERPAPDSGPRSSRSGEALPVALAVRDSGTWLEDKEVAVPSIPGTSSTRPVGQSR